MFLLCRYIYLFLCLVIYYNFCSFYYLIFSLNIIFWNVLYDVILLNRICFYDFAIADISVFFSSNDIYYSFYLIIFHF